MKLQRALPYPRSDGGEVDASRLVGAMLCSLVTVGLYMLLTIGVAGEAIRWAILAMATISAVLAINGLGWNALTQRPAQGTGRSQIVEVPPTLDVIAIWPPLESCFGMPVIADPEGLVARSYDMIHPESDPAVTVRSVFVIDPARKVRLILTYPPSTGRNFAENLRAIDSLQLTDAHSVATPVNWTPGDTVVISPKLSDEEAQRRFPQGFQTLKPYLRFVELQPAGQ